MSFSAPKIIDPLRLSLILSGFVFVFFIIGLISILTFSWRENKNYVRSLSHTVIKTQVTQLESGSFREFVESLGQEFPNIYVSIRDGYKTFDFGKKSNLTSCYRSVVHSESFQREIQIRICKPLAIQLSGLIPLILSFFVVLLLVVRLAFRIENNAIKSLADFLGNIGISVKRKLSFSDLLNQIKNLQSEFASLKKKMLLANEQQTKAKIASYLAHDLRSPLLVFQEVLRLQNLEEFSEIKPRLFSSLSRIQFMINGLKDNDFRQICLSELDSLDLRNVIAEIKMQAKEQSIRFVSRVRKENVSFILDREKIERAVVNLLQNAIEAAKTMVALEAKVDGKDWVLKVFDDGEGVPDEFEALIYQEHFTHGKAHGTGLGLSYVKEVVQGHHGSLCHYRYKDLTVFEIKLLNCVRSKDSKVSLQRLESLKIARTSRRRENVLIVVSNEKLRIELKNKLQSSQWVFCNSIEEVENFFLFSILYSDEPEAIKMAISKDLKPIVALASDTASKAVLKINRILDSKLQFDN